MNASAWHHIYWIAFWSSAGIAGIWLLLRRGYVPVKQYRAAHERRKELFADVAHFRNEVAGYVEMNELIKRNYDRVRGDLEVAESNYLAEAGAKETALRQLEAALNNQVATDAALAQEIERRRSAQTELRVMYQKLMQLLNDWHGRTSTVVGRADAIKAITAITKKEEK